MTNIGNHEIDDPSVLRAFSYRLIFNRRELVFRGEGGGEMGGGGMCFKPPFLNICSRRFIPALLIFKFSLLVGIQFHFQTNAIKPFWENGKSIQLSGSQLSKASRPITYRSIILKRWNISEGRVFSLLKSRVLCKKIST